VSACKKAGAGGAPDARGRCDAGGAGRAADARGECTRGPGKTERRLVRMGAVLCVEKYYGERRLRGLWFEFGEGGTHVLEGHQLAVGPARDAEAATPVAGEKGEEVSAA